MFEQAYLERHQTVREYVRCFGYLSIFEGLRCGPSGAMTARCGTFTPGGSVAAGHDREPEVRDTRIASGVHENVLLFLGEYQTEQGDVK